MRKFLVVIILIFIASLSLPGENRTDELNYLSSLKKDVSPQTTIFAFDLHEVLFEKKVRTMIWNCTKALAKGMIWYTFNPFFWYKAKEVCSQNTMWENIFKQMVIEYPGLAKFENDYQEVATSYAPIWPMIEWLKKLKAKGYKLLLLSNIPEGTYKKHKEKFPEIMAYFDGMYIPCSRNNYIHKPQPEYYKGFKNYLNELNLSQKQIIFIDDLKENIDIALQFDIACIYFKTVEQFQDVLKFLKII